MSLLVPIDFSDSTPRVCEVAIEEAKARGAKVWLVHVAAPDPAFVGYEAGPDTVRDQIAAELREEHREIQVIAQRFEAAGVDVTPQLVQGETVATILEMAERHQSTMIIMATHGRGLVYQMMVGSVSEGVLRQAKVPVLLVPSK